MFFNTYFNSHPHEEDDAISKTRQQLDNDFNSHPHEEDDSVTASPKYLVVYFNSHPHEEDDEILRVLKITDEEFQLTSSRRG